MDRPNIARVLAHPSSRFTELTAAAGLDPSRDFVALNLSDIAVEADEDLSGYNFSHCIMHRACLRGVDLRGARFEKSDLSFADLSGALFHEAQFATCILADADVRGAATGSMGDSRDRPTSAPTIAGKMVSAEHLFAVAEPNETQSFVGRERFIQRLAKRIQDGARSLLIVGAKGVGKSSLIQMAAKLLEDGSLPVNDDTSGDMVYYRTFVMETPWNQEDTSDFLASFITDTEEGSFLESFSGAFFQHGEFTPLVHEMNPLLCEDLADRSNLYGDIRKTFQAVVETLTDEQKVTLFKEAIIWAKDYVRDNTHFVFFVDDVHRFSNIHEMVDEVSQITEAVFVFAASEHDWASPADFGILKGQFSGDVVELTPLQLAEVNKLIDIAESRSSGMITFSLSFREAIFHLSCGNPGVLSTLGYLAVSSVLGGSGTLSAPVELTHGDLVAAASQMLQDDASIAAVMQLTDAMDTPLLVEICFEIDDCNLPIGREKLIHRLRSKFRPATLASMERALDHLVRTGIIRKDGSGVSFENPVFRLELARLRGRLEPD